MAAVKKPRGRVWENRETMLLLQKWGDENIQTKLLSCTRKKPIWQEISAFLRAAGYEDRDEDACKTRIHTLVSAYRSYKDECRKKGNGTPKKKPAFFDEVRKALHEAKECRYFFPNCHWGWYTGLWRRKQRKCRKRCAKFNFQQQRQQQQSQQMPGTKKGCLCDMYRWAFKKKLSPIGGPDNCHT